MRTQRKLRREMMTWINTIMRELLHKYDMSFE